MPTVLSLPGCAKHNKIGLCALQGFPEPLELCHNPNFKFTMQCDDDSVWLGFRLDSQKHAKSATEIEVQEGAPLDGGHPIGQMGRAAVYGVTGPCKRNGPNCKTIGLMVVELYVEVDI
jgi:hypothetical protein